MIGWLLLNWQENVSLVTMMNRTIKKQRLLKVGWLSWVSKVID